MFKQKQIRNTRIGIAAGTSIAIMAFGAARIFVQAAPDVPTLIVGRDFPLRDARTEAQYVVCPWRQPDADIARFFPAVAKSAVIRDETLVYTRQRLLLTRLLGRAPTGAENALLIHRILLRPRVNGRAAVPASSAASGNGQQQASGHNDANIVDGETSVGVIMTRYVRGASGVIELVLAVDARERVIGASIQRLREPDDVARDLQSTRFLEAFRGKTYASAWTPAPSAIVASTVSGADAAIGGSNTFHVSANAILDEAHTALVLLHVGEQNLAHPG